MEVEGKEGHDPDRSGDEIYIVPDNGNCKTHTLNRHLGHPNCEPEGQ